MALAAAAAAVAVAAGNSVCYCCCRCRCSGNTRRRMRAVGRWIRWFDTIERAVVIVFAVGVFAAFDVGAKVAAARVLSTTAVFGRWQKCLERDWCEKKKKKIQARQTCRTDAEARPGRLERHGCRGRGQPGPFSEQRAPPLIARCEMRGGREPGQRDKEGAETGEAGYVFCVRAHARVRPTNSECKADASDKSGELLSPRKKNKKEC